MNTGYSVREDGDGDWLQIVEGHSDDAMAHFYYGPSLANRALHVVSSVTICIKDTDHLEDFVRVVAILERINFSESEKPQPTSFGLHELPDCVEPDAK